MNTEITGIIFILAIVTLMSYPLGKYISGVFKGSKTFLDILTPFENFLFKISKINPVEDMSLKQNIYAMLTINFIWFLFGLIILSFQNFLFLNPDGIENMDFSLAVNTAVSFMTNTNLQHYSGEIGASYLSQIAVFCFLQFVSAGTGIAVCALIFRYLSPNKSEINYNFFGLLVKSCTRILLPLSLIIAFILVLNGTPSTFKGSEKIISLQGDTVEVARGPVAPMVAIKQIGTNGGGFFGTNSSHPFENPNIITNSVENAAILLIPFSLVFAFGFYSERKKLSVIIFSVMILGFLCLLIPSVYSEMNGNPEIDKFGIS